MKAEVPTEICSNMFEINNEPASLKTLTQMMMLLIHDYASLSVKLLDEIKLRLQQYDFPSVVKLLKSHYTQVPPSTHS